VQGAVISGLNVKIGLAVSTSISDFGNGTKTYEYDSCAVAAALAGFGTLTPLSNTWIDNWAW
jgi:hypothetical protein